MGHRIVNNDPLFHFSTNYLLHRHGGDEEWPTFAPVNTKYFSGLDCINARWSQCVEWHQDRPGNDMHSGSKNSVEECADWCGSLQNDCDGYQFISGSNYCYLKKPVPGKISSYNKHFGYLGRCYYHWYGGNTIQPPNP